MIRSAGHGALILALTVVSQIGGLAWLVALAFRRRLVALVACYALLFALAHALAPVVSGRVALPCFGAPLRSQSVLYCGLLRNFVTPDARDVALRAAEAVDREFPGTVTLTLDGGFPFLTLPLLPHLSHDDGRKLDFALYYRDRSGIYLPGRTRSPVGYFAFEAVGPETCPRVFPTLRWDLAWLQPLWPDRPLDHDRTAALARALLTHAAVDVVFLEPPLARALGLSDDRLRFQGCRAARHDDHLHVSVRG